MVSTSFERGIRKDLIETMTPGLSNPLVKKKYQERKEVGIGKTTYKKVLQGLPQILKGNFCEERKVSPTREGNKGEKHGQSEQLGLRKCA